MDFLAKQRQRDREELLSAVKPETPVPVQTMETDLEEGWTLVTYTKPQRRWKRLVTLLTISQVHVLTGLILEMIEAAREQAAERALELAKRLARQDARWLRAAAAKKVDVKVKAKALVDKPMAKGKALSRSIQHLGRRAVWQAEIKDCDHPEAMQSHPRAAHGVGWTTCLKCGGRWERIFEDPKWMTPQVVTVQVKTMEIPNNQVPSEAGQSSDPKKEDSKIKSLVPVSAEMTPSASQSSIMTPRDQAKRRNPEVVASEATQELDQTVLALFQQGCASGHPPAEVITQMLRDARDTEAVDAVRRLTKTLS